MESVKRFKFKGADYVYAADFDRVTAEREALQLLLNNRDDLDDQLTSLEQRRYAEQQAREAAERRVVELVELLRTHTDHVATLCDVMFRFGLGMDKEPEQKIYSALAQQQVVFAALNPTAEAESHE